MNATFSVPSKTYLTGEYAVLAGGPAIVLCTGPRFKLEVRSGVGGIQGIPNGSPAHKWLQQRAPLLSNWQIRFIDPHAERGGLGASGAQFICAHAFTTWLQSDFKLDRWNPADAFHDYKVLGQGSGADILAQAAGQVAVVDMKATAAESSSWPFRDLAFAVVRTGIKVPTHEHLRNLEHTQLRQLSAPARESVEALTHPVSAAETACVNFVRSVNAYANALEELNLLSPTTRDLLTPIRRQDWCLAAKGCGAYGADTIALLFDPKNEARMRDYCKSANLEIVSTELSGGLQV